jgi:signal transduction histidine kinase
MPVFHQDGSFDRFISTSRDVTVEIENDFKLAQIREQIARDFHDEMGNKLASITLNSNVLKTLIVDGDAKVLETVRRIEKNSTSLYHNSRDFIWSINSKSDNLLELFAYIKDFAEELLYTSDCNLKVDAQNLKDIDLPITYSRHIVL